MSSIRILAVFILGELCKVGDGVIIRKCHRFGTDNEAMRSRSPYTK